MMSVEQGPDPTTTKQLIEAGKYLLPAAGVGLAWLLDWRRRAEGIKRQRLDNAKLSEELQDTALDRETKQLKRDKLRHELAALQAVPKAKGLSDEGPLLTGKVADQMRIAIASRVAALSMQTAWAVIFSRALDEDGLVYNTVESGNYSRSFDDSIGTLEQDVAWLKDNDADPGTLLWIEGNMAITRDAWSDHPLNPNKISEGDGE